MKIKIWGCRGSLPTPTSPKIMRETITQFLRDYAKMDHQTVTPEKFLENYPDWMVEGFGGHTACVEVSTKTKSLIIDGGSGIRRVGSRLVAGPCGAGKGEAHILFTHFHWDHLIGLPFFMPFFIPGNTIHVYAVQKNLKEIFSQIFKKPFFPVPLERLSSNIVYHTLEPRETIEFDDLKVTPYELDHPDPCWGYKFEHNNKVFSYAVDSETTRMSRADMGADLPLYQNVDLLFFDAQYTFRELVDRIDWGHGAAPVGIDIAMREKIKEIYFFHHDPSSSDQKIAEAEKETRQYVETKLAHERRMGREIHHLKWAFAREELEFDLDKKEENL